MTDWLCKSSWQRALIGIAVLIFCGSARADEVTLTPTTIGLPPGPAETSTQSLFLRPAGTGSVKIDSLVVEYVAGPDDVRLDTKVVETDLTPGASGTVISFNIKLTTSAFMRPGTYKIALRVKGERILPPQPVAPQQQPPAAPPQQPAPPPAPPQAAPAPPVPPSFDQLAVLQLTRAPGELTVAIGNNQMVTAERSFPGRAAQVKVTFSLSQDKGPDIGMLALAPGSIVRSSNNELVPGQVALEPPGLAVANGKASGTLVFSGLRRAGDFKADLAFTSPALAKPVPATIAVRVKDSWILPLIVITLGVFSGALVHFLVRMWRPHQLSAFRLTELRGRLEALRGMIGLPATRYEYDRLLENLQRLADGLEVDLTTDAAITQLEGQVDDLQKRLATAEASAADSLREQQQAFANLEADLARFPPASTSDDLKALKKQLDACKALLDENRAEEALQCVTASKAKLSSERQRLARAAVAEMQKDIAKDVPEAKREALNAKAQEILTRLDDPAMDLGHELAALRQAIAKEAGMESDALAPVPPAPIGPHILIAPGADDRLAGSPLTFSVDGLPSTKQIGEVRWTIDGTHASSGTATATSKVFPVAGRFAVAADIQYRDGTSDHVGPIGVSILPSAAAVAGWVILRRIQQIDVALLLFAVIVAAVAGLLDRYVDKPFGTVTDYCLAFLWGFGVDSAVKGFSAAFSKITGK